MPKLLSELEIGEAVHDMHDGYPKWDGLDVNLRSLVFIRTPMPGSTKVVLAMLEGRACYLYTNKMLVLVGKNHQNRYVFAYSYDNRELGIYEVEELG